MSYHANGNLVGNSLAAPWTFDWSNVPAGRYRLTAQATDNMGATATSAAVIITVGVPPPDTAYYIETDHLNTPRLIADGSGTTVWRWDQAEPFGDSVPDNNPSGFGVFELNLRLPGQYTDRETGLSYNMRRDYDPQIARYVESDPIGLKAGLNPYAYVKADPLRFVDPLGLVRWTGAIVAGGAFDGLGAAGLLFDLTSQCVCGRKLHVNGFASGVGAGLALLDPTVTATNVEFEDYRPCPDSSVFNGLFTMSSAGVVAYGGSAITLGRAASLHAGPTIGNEIGGSVVVGASAVMSVTEEKCCK